MTISKAGLDLICEFEGYHKALPDGSCQAYTNKVVDAFVQQYGRLPTQAEFAQVFTNKTLALPLAGAAASGPVNEMLSYYQGQQGTP